MRIAFVGTDQIGIAPDDAIAAAMLEERGVRVEPWSWSNPLAPWSEFDKIVVRSTWDYHLRPELFRAWIEARVGAPLWNPPEVLRWNLDKRYLLDLARRGVPTVPTKLVERGADPAAALSEWPEAVVKPAISASAFRTFRARGGRLPAEAEALCSERDVLVQPFVKEVQLEGEWSICFFGGVFSHAVIRRPAAGDFRVQQEHGGSVTPAQPDDALVEAARAALPPKTLYARVDGVRIGGVFHLMELELIEPCLFFANDRQAAGRFCDALLSLQG